MKPYSRCSFGLLALATMASAHAQDSVSKVHCTPGDALNPWQDATSPLGSDQVKHYVVDAQDLFSSWGNNFLIAPISKAGQSNPAYFNTFMGAQSISRRALKNKSFPHSSYPVWTSLPGTGVNSDPSRNDAPASSVNTAGKKGVQFAAVFGENDSTGINDREYYGIVTSVVNVDPEDPRRLYVTRVQAAANGCDNDTQEGAMYSGGVDANGNAIVRADNQDLSPVSANPCPGTVLIAGNNYYVIDALGRNSAIRNVVSGTFPGLFDAPATNWALQASATTHSVPTVAPEEVFGTAGVIGANFSKQYVRGFASPLTADTTQLPAGATDIRGCVSYLSKNFALLGSSRGLVGSIAHNATGVANQMIVYGLDAALNVTGKIGLALPASITDNDDGFTNLGPGTNQFDHYHSQAAFQGGNGQVALNIDAQGNLLAAAQVSMPLFGSATNPENYIAVSRTTPAGVTSWTMAGYCSGLGFGIGSGKPIKDSPGGNIIGTMVPSQKFTTVQGPSVSAPMIDGAGNVWFIANVEIYGSGTLTALLRSVYSAASFSYELEMVCPVGSATQFLGVNSGTNYIVSFLPIADTNSVSSGTAFSNNITEDGFMGIDGSCFDPIDARSLGGIVLGASITYDTSGDGIFESCLSNPASTDENYRVLLYIGANGSTGVDNYGVNCAGSGGIAPTLTFDGYPKQGKTVNLSITNAIGGQSAILFFGLVQGSINLPGPCSLLVAPILPLNITLPLFGSPTPGGGSISFPAVIPTVPTGFTVTMQALCTDPGVFWGYNATQGVQLTFQ